LYSRARLFVWPSYYEGFGFPPLEAMSYGVPVIASSVSSLPEILGPAAILVNPHDVNNLAEAMQLVLSNETLRQKLVQLGRAVSQNFIWRDSIAKVAALINSL
jgi:glycosyltransferase involved in cell wall biosynthesis